MKSVNLGGLQITVSGLEEMTDSANRLIEALEACKKIVRELEQIDIKVEAGAPREDASP